MGLVIGMDEAGLGPNLGPLVITATVWEVPDPPTEFDFWQALQPAVSAQPARREKKLHIADSKVVYTPGKGPRELERSVLAVLALSEQQPPSYASLCHLLGSPLDAQTLDFPLPTEDDSRLPCCLKSLDEEVVPYADALQDCCRESGIRLRTIRSEVLFPQRFNRLIAETGSKGVLLSQTSLRLLRSVWDPADPAPTLVIGDKHGGRNQYHDLLADIVDGAFVFVREESREISRYRVGPHEVRFQMKAESHFPVAVASLVSKYLRELSMESLNRFWRQHLPDLKPTKGYPQDAKRFRREIAEKQAELQIADDVIWRCR